MTTVSYTPDPKKKPQLTEEQERKLAELKDEDIDYSDIPELDDDFWKNAQPVMLPKKSRSLRCLVFSMNSLRKEVILVNTDKSLAFRNP